VSEDICVRLCICIVRDCVICQVFVLARILPYHVMSRFMNRWLCSSLPDTCRVPTFDHAAFVIHLSLYTFLLCSSNSIKTFCLCHNEQKKEGRLAPAISMATPVDFDSFFDL